MDVKSDAPIVAKINWKHGFSRLLIVMISLWYIAFAIPIVTTHIEYYDDFREHLRWPSIEQQRRAEVTTEVISRCEMSESERAAQRQLVSSLCDQRTELRERLIANVSATEGTPSDSRRVAPISSEEVNPFAELLRGVSDQCRRLGESSQPPQRPLTTGSPEADSLLERIRQRRAAESEQQRLDRVAGVNINPDIRALDQQIQNAFKKGDGTVPTYCGSPSARDQEVALRISFAIRTLEAEKPSDAAAREYVTWVILPILLPILFLIVLFVLLRIVRWVFAGFVAK